jgi:ATP-dependent Clp protease ATP-binding subunit ClpA
MAMPKINVYLPDDLAAQVKEAGIPVSPVCQQALAEAVRSVGRARQVIGAMRRENFDPQLLPQLAERVLSRSTGKLIEVFRLAGAEAGTDRPVRPEHFLIAVIKQDENLGVRLLRTLEVDTDLLRSEAMAAAALGTELDEVGEAITGTVPEPAGVDAEPGSARSTLLRLTPPARLVLASTLSAALDLAHNYLGCEHLLLGILQEEDTAAAELLRAQGIQHQGFRRALAGASAGISHVRQSSASTADITLEQIMHRLNELERRLPPATDAG